MIETRKRAGYDDKLENLGNRRQPRQIALETNAARSCVYLYLLTEYALYKNDYKATKIVVENSTQHKAVGIRLLAFYGA